MDKTSWPKPKANFKMKELAEFNAQIARGDVMAVKQFIQTKRVTPESCEHLPSWSVPVSVAAVNGQVDILNILLSEGFPQHADRQPLHFACIMGHMAIVQSLVEDHQVDVMSHDCKGQTPLYLAIFNDKFEIVKYLIQAGADVNNCGRMPPIVIAVIHYKPEMCQYLIDQGANVNVHDNFGRSPLAAAARSGSKNIACALLEAGADVNIRSREGTPFLAASKSGRMSMLKLLFTNGADINVSDVDGDTALHLAVTEGHYQVARYLIVDVCVNTDTVNHHGKTAFQMALEGMDVDMMYLFHKAGYSPARELSNYFHFEIESPAKDVLFQCISDLTNIPYSLQELACFRVRKCLRSRVDSLVCSLPVPETVKDEIMLKHIPQKRSRSVCAMK